MVTRMSEKVITIYGLSTDEKPVENIANGSKFYEIDTKKTYYFDAENKVWRA